MKKFLLRSALFLGLVLLIFGSICGFELRYELKAYREEVKAPAAATILVCNDSQLEMSVNPAVEPAFFNFSAPGRTMDQAYLAMLDVFAANPGRFRKVVIDLSPSAAVDPFDQAIPDMGYASQYYLLHWLHPRENTRDMTGQIAVFRDNMVGRRWRLFWRALRGKGDFTSSICGRYKPTLMALALTMPDDFKGQFRARAHTVNDVPALTADAPIFRHVNAIIDLARAHGAEPILVTTPWHAELLKAGDAEKMDAFAKVVSAYAAERKCKYVDLLRVDLPDDCWYDAQHLNVKGAKRFTSLLKSVL